MYEAATLIQCKKIGPFPVILMDKKFWKNVKDLTQYQVEMGAVGKDEIGFALRLDSPEIMVKTLLECIPDDVKQKLPVKQKKSK
jgi:predicted Rossmann-fold nucleotide-binding protein